jgi:hypothetical protein
MNNPFCLQINIDFKGVDKFDQYEFNPIHAHFDDKDGRNVLSLIYDSTTYLQEAIVALYGYCSTTHEPLGNRVTVVDCKDNGRLQAVSFKDSISRSISSSSDRIEGKSVLDIKLDSALLEFSPLADEERLDSQFYLNEAGFRLVANQQFTLRLEGDNKYAVRTTKKWKTALGLRYRLDFEFNPKESRYEKQVIIEKTPRILIRTDSHLPDKLYQTADVLCSALSFFAHDKVDYVMGRTISKEKVCEKVTLVEEAPSSKASLGWFANQYHISLSKYLSQVKFERFQEKNGLLGKLVDKFNLCYHLEGESQFLVLYNILEQFRANLTTKQPKYKHTFSKSEDEVKALFKTQMEPIRKLIPKREREDFDLKVDNFAGKLIYQRMLDQFDEMLKENKLTDPDFREDFKKMLGMRNKMVHGSDKKLSDAKIKRYGSFLMRLVCTLLLRQAGIKGVDEYIKSPKFLRA